MATEPTASESKPVTVAFPATRGKLVQVIATESTELHWIGRVDFAERGSGYKAGEKVAVRKEVATVLA